MTRLGDDALTASNGESALQAVLDERPDLVLLDVNMPGIDGFEVPSLEKPSSDAAAAGGAHHELDGERGSHPRH
jgi:DNA-binding response OmpR family regulator